MVYRLPEEGWNKNAAGATMGGGRVFVRGRWWVRLWGRGGRRPPSLRPPIPERRAANEAAHYLRGLWCRARPRPVGALRAE